MRLCRRRCTALPALLSLCLLSFIAIIYSSRKVNVRRSHLVSISDTTRGATPVISGKDLPMMLHEDVHRPTDMSPRNGGSHPLPQAPADHLTNGHPLTRNVMSTNDESIAELKTLPNPVLGRDRSQVRNAAFQGIVRGRGLGRSQFGRGLEDPEMKRLQEMFPLSPHFSFPNPQVCQSAGVCVLSESVKCHLAVAHTQVLFIDIRPYIHKCVRL